MSVEHLFLLHLGAIVFGLIAGYVVGRGSSPIKSDLIGYNREFKTIILPKVLKYTGLFVSISMKINGKNSKQARNDPKRAKRTFSSL